MTEEKKTISLEDIREILLKVRGAAGPDAVRDIIETQWTADGERAERLRDVRSYPDLYHAAECELIEAEIFSAAPAIVGFDEEAIRRSVREALEERFEITLEDVDGDDDYYDQQVPLRELQRGIHDLAREKGWWDNYDRDDQGRLKLTTDQVISKIALIHAELSEAVEEARKSPNYSEIYYDTSKPEGFAVELADALIRILDLFGALGIDAADIVRIKHEYNKTRPRRHGGKLA